MPPKEVMKKIDDLKKEDAIEFIEKVEGVSFESTLKSEDEKNNIRRYGFIVDDVAKLNEKLVDFMNDDPDMIKTEGTLAIYHKLIKSHQNDIKEVKKENKEIKERLKEVNEILRRNLDDEDSDES